MAASTWVSSSRTDDEALVPPMAGAVCMGFTCREAAATAAAAAFVLRRGRTPLGVPIAYVNLAADESTRDWYGPNGIACDDGIYIDRESGTTEVAVFVEPP